MLFELKETWVKSLSQPKDSGIVPAIRVRRVSLRVSIYLGIYLSIPVRPGQGLKDSCDLVAVHRNPLQVMKVTDRFRQCSNQIVATEIELFYVHAGVALHAVAITGMFFIVNHIGPVRSRDPLPNRLRLSIGIRLRLSIGIRPRLSIGIRLSVRGVRNPQIYLKIKSDHEILR